MFQPKLLPAEQQSPWPYILPFAVLMLIASRTPEITSESVDDVAVINYFWLIVIQVIFTGFILTLVHRRFLRDFPPSADWWGVLVGVVGFGLWIGICGLGIERTLFGWCGMGDWWSSIQRVGFDPYSQISDTGRRTAFLVFRLVLMAMMVPLIEELFLRGWLVRYFDNGQNVEWHDVRLDQVGWSGVGIVALYAAATHPTETIAAVVWFSLVSWLMIKTGKFWNCVLAHATTNLLLGLYVLSYGQWHYW
jgi:hypothetical protein